MEYICPRCGREKLVYYWYKIYCLACEYVKYFERKRVA